MDVELVHGNLLEQDVEAIVNSWNRNVLPWWLLLPQGVSGQIKRRAGVQPFRELRAFGRLPLGAAVLTSAGKLPYKAIIHVAALNLLWRATSRSVRDSAINAVVLAEQQNFSSLAMPVIGSGTGGYDRGAAMALMLEALTPRASKVRCRIVQYRK